MRPNIATGFQNAALFLPKLKTNTNTRASLFNTLKTLKMKFSFSPKLSQEIKMESYKEKIFETLAGFACLFENEPSVERLQAYTEELAKYSPEKLTQTFNELKKTADRFPSLSQIIKIIDPIADEKDQANELAGEIIDCISRLGSYNADEVKKKVGDIGWFAIERFGGWSQLCQINYDQMGTARAQLRDICKMAIKLNKKDPGQLQLTYTERRSSSKLKKLIQCFDEKQVEKN